MVEAPRYTKGQRRISVEGTMRYNNRTFTREVVQLDGNEFQGCTFRECRLDYGGTTPVFLYGCHFDDCTWGFVGDALNTITWLTFLYQMDTSTRQVVEDIIDNIRHGNFLAPPPTASTP